MRLKPNWINSVKIYLTFRRPPRCVLIVLCLSCAVDLCDDDAVQHAASASSNSSAASAKRLEASKLIQEAALKAYKAKGIQAIKAATPASSPAAPAAAPADNPFATSVSNLQEEAAAAVKSAAQSPDSSNSKSPNPKPPGPPPTKRHKTNDMMKAVIDLIQVYKEDSKTNSDLMHEELDVRRKEVYKVLFML